MKTKLVLWLAGSAMLGACQQSARTTVEGALTGLESDTLVVTYFPLSDLRREEVKTDTIVAQQGKFTYSLENDSVPTELFFSVKPPQGEDMKSLRKTAGVIAFPGETVRLSGAMGDCKVEGNEFHKAYMEIEEQCKSYKHRLNEITETIMNHQKNGTMTPTLIDSLRKIYQPVYNDMMNVQKEYVKQHPDADVSVYLVSGLGSRNAKELMETIGEKARTGALAPLYQAMENALEKEKARTEAASRITEGKEAPDFSLKDIHGNNFSLSSLRGKYVVLDFWGSWCGWCIKGMPDMKKAYEQYKDKMEIVGIDCGDTEEKWKEAVEKHRLPWTHVRNSSEADVTVMYAVSGYPTKIVIDKEGKIAKVAVGEDPSFYAYLDSLFKK